MRPSPSLFVFLCLASFGALAQSLPAEARCGDGQQSRGEVCDDGNNLSGDGCSADCASLELCGDKQLNPKEQCDDGNTIDGDGCDARCGEELPLKLPEKAKRRALIGTLASYPLLLLLSPQVPPDNNDVAIALLGVSSGLAPSLGHFYTKAYGRGLLTALPRYILNAGTVVSIAFFSALNDTSPLDAEARAQATLITSVFLVPSIALSVWDILDAPRSIDRMMKKGKYKK